MRPKASCNMTAKEKWENNNRKKFLLRYGSDDAKRGTDHKNRPNHDGFAGGETRLKEMSAHLDSSGVFRRQDRKF